VESAPTQTQNNQHISVTSGVSTVLYNRGLDSDVADELAGNFVKDDVLLATMVENIVTHTEMRKEDVLTYLSNEALFGKSVSLDSYDTLVAMMYKKPVDLYTLNQLQKIAKMNRYLDV